MELPQDPAFDEILLSTASLLSRGFPKSDRKDYVIKIFKSFSYIKAEFWNILSIEAKKFVHVNPEEKRPEKWIYSCMVLVTLILELIKNWPPGLNMIFKKSFPVSKGNNSLSNVRSAIGNNFLGTGASPKLSVLGKFLNVGHFLGNKMNPDLSKWQTDDEITIRFKYILRKDNDGSPLPRDMADIREDLITRGWKFIV